MILDFSKLEKTQIGKDLYFQYPLTFNDKERYAVVQIQGSEENRQIFVFLNKTDVKSGIDIEGENLSTNDIKVAWERFEDLFKESDEGKAQQPEDPEPTNLYLTLNAVGDAKLFTQTLKGKQEVIYEYEVLDMDLRKFPNSYELDYTNDTNMPEPLRAKWLLANTNGDVKLENMNDSYSTYQVAILSVTPPTENPPPPSDEENDEMPFFRLVSATGGIANLKQYTFNKKTKEIKFVKDELLPLSNNTEPYKVNTPQGEGTLMPYPTLDGDGLKAYLIALQGGDGGNPSPEPPEDGGTPSPEPPEDGGTPSPEPPEDGGTPSPEPPEEEGEPVDDDDEEQEDEIDDTKSAKTRDNIIVDYDDLVNTIAVATDLSPSEVSQGLRSKQAFKDLIQLNDINWQGLATTLKIQGNNLDNFASIVYNTTKNN